MAKGNTKTFYKPIQTGRGTARYPKLNEPDTKGEYADGKYKVEIVVDEVELKRLKKEMYDFAKKVIPHVAKPKLPIMKDKKDGTVFVRFKSTNKPLITDAQNNRLPDHVKVGAGSVIRVAGSMANYEKGSNKGITLYLGAVRVIELAEGGGGSPETLFGDKEVGYTYEAGANDRFDDEDEKGRSGSQDDDYDYESSDSDEDYDTSSEDEDDALAL